MVQIHIHMMSINSSADAVDLIRTSYKYVPVCLSYDAKRTTRQNHGGLGNYRPKTRQVERARIPRQVPRNILARQEQEGGAGQDQFTTPKPAWLPVCQATAAVSVAVASSHFARSTHIWPFSWESIPCWLTAAGSSSPPAFGGGTSPGLWRLLLFGSESACPVDVDSGPSGCLRTGQGR